MLKRLRKHAVRTQFIAALLTLTACIPPGTPTDDDFDEYFREQAASVAGTWRGRSIGRDIDVLTLELNLRQTGTAVTGAGMMQERGIAGTRPVTITGSYNRPSATLTIGGIQFEGRAVTGMLRASNTIGILADTLVLTGENYERKLAVFLSRP